MAGIALNVYQEIRLEELEKSYRDVRVIGVWDLCPVIEHHGRTNHKPQDYATVSVIKESGRLSVLGKKLIKEFLCRKR